MRQQKIGLNFLPSKMSSINAVLLAAGEGQRLRPLTKFWPKSLMPVHGIPLMEYWLSDLIRCGIDPIYVNTCYLAEVVEEYLARDRFNQRVHILREQKLLGTGGTILKLSDQLLDRPTMVIHADNWCGFKLDKMIDHHINERPPHCLITMMTFETETPSTCGIVELDKNNVVQAFHEKISHPPGNRANAAVYLIEPEVVIWMKAHGAQDFSIDVLPNFLGKISTIHNTSFHRDIGNIWSLIDAQGDLARSTIWEKQDNWLRHFKSNAIHQLLNDFSKKKQIP
jgi:mannose-1-phosphate guanylyltransferase